MKKLQSPCVPRGRQIIKSSAKSIVETFLIILVKIKLKRTHPIIIGVTGSLGKTSTKEAIFHVLSTQFHAYRNQKSLNTEIGLLLAILEQPSGFSSPLAWLRILFHAVGNAFFGKKYDFLVLEYGADKPGDIANLVKIVPPHAAIITHIARVHQAPGQFKNIDEVFDEKKKLVTCLKKSGTAVLNFDDPMLKKLEGKLHARTMWWSGKGNQAATIYAEKKTTTARGFSAQITMASQSITADFPIPGAYHIDIILPALLCGVIHGVPLKEGIDALRTFTLPPGRMSILEGVNDSTLLDGSYNASPETTKQALNLLREFPGKRKIAVIGNMNELGEFTKEAHEELALEIGSWLDMLITLGEYAAMTAEACLKRGFPKDKIKSFHDAHEVGEALLSEGISPGDIILFKGSQNRVRLERAVKMCMRHKQEAKKLLCRQEKEWECVE